MNIERNKKGILYIGMGNITEQIIIDVRDLKTSLDTLIQGQSSTSWLSKLISNKRGSISNELQNGFWTKYYKVSSHWCEFGIHNKYIYE